MVLIREGVNFLDIQSNEEDIVALRGQFQGVPMIEASGLPYFTPQQWGVAKWISTKVPPDVVMATGSSILLYDRATLLTIPDYPFDLIDALVVYVTKNSNRFTAAVAVWDVRDDGT